ncbi:hypothetical protein L1987_58716 [Smallanthus sonchifolius]|uniref:Uncharacterized protein n=1 Tax=Smallanthus sonchifolius TaxID=185202 RepID=A0ACB9D3A3_9ASTR|nr:hypothetical protein L1987_58716 [Smallanthus sonchifolius]
MWVPRSGDFRLKILDEAHKSRYSIHLGTTKMYQDLRKDYWWPGMKFDIMKYVAKCLTFLQVKAEHQKLYGRLQPIEIPKWKWEHLTMDFITKLPKTARDYDTIWVVVDRLTKSAHFLEIHETYSSKKLADLFIKEIVSRHGVPVSIVSDRDTRFTSRFWKKFHEEMGTRLLISMAYHPQTDGQTTISVLVCHHMRCYMEGDVGLPYVGEKLDRHKSYADKRRRPIEFQEGDYIMLKVSPWKGLFRFKKRGKLSPQFIGPFRIIKKVGKVAYQLELPEELNKIHNTFHVSYLRKCLADETAHVPLEEIEVDNKLTYVEEPTKILDTKEKQLRHKTIKQMLVQWKHRKGSEMTWESEDEMRRSYPQIFKD